MTSELTTFTVKVVGRVQGVGYRAWVKKIEKHIRYIMKMEKG